MTTATRTASYKGRTYRLEYLGPTKYGRRAKLAFMDGGKEFWVDAALVTEGGTKAASARQSTWGSGCNCNRPYGCVGGRCARCNEPIN